MYCQRLKPADTFHLVARGRGGKNRVYQCDDCFQARKTPEKSKERLKTLIEENVASNKSAYRTVTK
jgi:hypothetical protein